MLSDLKLAVRQLAKSPGFALTAIVTLALGIGVNAVMFSVLNALLLRPVNVPNAQNFYTVQRFGHPPQAYPDYLDLRDRNRTFESLMAVKVIGACRRGHRWKSLHRVAVPDERQLLRCAGHSALSGAVLSRFR